MADSESAGQARLLASSSLFQLAAQGTGLISLFVIVTVLARRLALPEFGAYGLLAPLAGYLLVLRNVVAGSAVKAMVEAAAEGPRSRTYSAAVVLYALAGGATGVLIASAGAVLSTAVLDGELERQTRLGALGLGAVTAFGITWSVNLDALRDRWASTSSHP